MNPFHQIAFSCSHIQGSGVSLFHDGMVIATFCRDGEGKIATENIVHDLVVRINACTLLLRSLKIQI